MHQADPAEIEIQTDSETRGAEVTENDETLAGFERDLGNVESALEALDADDLDGAEAVVADLAAVETPETVEEG